MPTTSPAEELATAVQARRAMTAHRESAPGGCLLCGNLRAGRQRLLPA
jgi:hypothetical protein